MKVLVVDDEAEIGKLFKLELERIGLKCLVASCSEEALNIIESEDIKLVVTDLDMPGDGHCLLAIIREKFGYGLPVYVFTGDQRSDDTNLRHLGADRIYTKPSSIRSIAMEINNHLNEQF